MSFEIVVSAETAYLRVEAKGTYSASEMFAFIDRAFFECNTRKFKRVLLDCSAICGDMSEADRFRHGYRFAETFGPVIKGAVVVATGQLTKLGELTARNRGANLLVTDSAPEAIDWLNAM